MTGDLDTFGGANIIYLRFEVGHFQGLMVPLHAMDALGMFPWKQKTIQHHPAFLGVCPHDHGHAPGILMSFKMGSNLKKLRFLDALLG